MRRSNLNLSEHIHPGAIYAAFTIIMIYQNTFAGLNYLPSHILDTTSVQKKKKKMKKEKKNIMQLNNLVKKWLHRLQHLSKKAPTSSVRCKNGYNSCLSGNTVSHSAVMYHDVPVGPFSGGSV